MFKVKGWQVYPAELEAILLQHPQILDTAVGVDCLNSDDLKETLPRAFVIRKSSSSRNPSEVNEYATPPQTSYFPATQLLTESHHPCSGMVSSKAIL